MNICDSRGAQKHKQFVGVSQRIALRFFLLFVSVYKRPATRYQTHRLNLTKVIIKKIC